ncbi:MULTISPECIES: YokU family protein [Bacillaceae]|uniref:YokU family protein n=1 Tax=Evansella alkalicola TaxID=745819 RepID=A0ABS6JNC4_9BACI|nr:MULTISPECIES: YokU family protein [Bacillaceae]MBU9720049.1 YokU family protein [Bacillus alkalicola]
MICKWCHSKHASESMEKAYWELPDGSRAIKMTHVPSISCPDCEMVYIEDDIIDEIEDHLMLIDTKNLPDVFSYQQLLDQPKLLKKNYFKF